MGASISYKLKNSLQGALAGGGDPATSPLYVFGPFLSLIVAAGVAKVTFGVSVWLAVFTVVTVSAMYRYVMRWITDGSGGSGLSEEEFGSWAVKINAAITVIEYTLTFLVSIAALVTFLADRFSILNFTFGAISLRTLIAIIVSILIAITVNRGPKIATKFFGPATALILIFLWMMIGTVIFQRGLVLPDFNLSAFDSAHIKFTLGGFARILALMTGIEIFANLVASYEGHPAKRSRMAFKSLLIVMGTTVTTMIVMGPAILELSNPLDHTKSVFTQTMDILLPSWLSYIGTGIGIAVLLSAAAASAQGIQNLALGLRSRHYIPANWGKRNTFDVPAFPVWAQVIIVIVTFMAMGTHEETYLSLYAAGVFILLSMTGWSSFKRFLRYFKSKPNIENFIGILLTLFSSICATFATVIIFEERFFDGAWTYLIMIPALFAVFDFYRNRLGAPPESIDKRLSAALNSGPIFNPNRALINYKIEKILTPLSGSLTSEVSFYASLKIAHKFNSSLYPLNISSPTGLAKNQNTSYLKELCKEWETDTLAINPIEIQGDIQKELLKTCEDNTYDLICMSSNKLHSLNKIFAESLAYKVIYATTSPLLLFRPTNNWISRSTEFKNIYVPLDGSELAEQVLPYVSAWACQYDSLITLITVPEIQGDTDLNKKLYAYLENIKNHYFQDIVSSVTCIVDGSGPLRTILSHTKENNCDLIATVSHGRGGLKRQQFVKLGSVAEGLLMESDIPILFISARNK